MMWSPGPSVLAEIDTAEWLSPSCVYTAELVQMNQRERYAIFDALLKAVMYLHDATPLLASKT